jgi:hypothetical protein
VNVRALKERKKALTAKMKETIIATIKTNTTAHGRATGPEAEKQQLRALPLFSRR